MPIIVAGHIVVQPGQRDAFIEQSLTAIQAARQTEGCDDFAVSPDPLAADRVNIYEHWRSEQDLHAFRATGPDSDLSALMLRVAVREYTLPE